MKNLKELSDWELIFEYENIVIKYAHNHFSKSREIISKQLTNYRREIAKRMGW
jgi:hypothetical protein